MDRPTDGEAQIALIEVGFRHDHATTRVRHVACRTVPLRAFLFWVFGNEHDASGEDGTMLLLGLYNDLLGQLPPASP
jgi:hypothetical protein